MVMPGGVMPGGAQGHNKVMMMYVGLNNGYVVTLALARDQGKGVASVRAYK